MSEIYYWLNEFVSRWGITETLILILAAPLFCVYLFTRRRESRRARVLRCGAWIPAVYGLHSARRELAEAQRYHDLLASQQAITPEQAELLFRTARHHAVWVVVVGFAVSALLWRFSRPVGTAAVPDKQSD